jgi:anti-sigma-K factor RskA
MNRRDPAVRSALAAEYALGTLRGAARRRFERLLRADAALRAEVWRWEARLADLALRLPPQQPEPGVWSALERRLAASRRAAVRRVEPRPAPLWRVWAGLAAAAVIVAFVVFTQTRTPTPPTAPPIAAQGERYVALLKLPDSTMQWTLSLVPARGEMHAVASGEYPQLGAHSLELWWISPQGPVPIGLLPTRGEGVMPLPKELATSPSITLAVSLEPPGGSPTGKPTGPVLTSAPAARAG